MFTLLKPIFLYIFILFLVPTTLVKLKNLFNIMVKILFIIHFVLYNTIMPTKKYLILGLDDNDDNDDNEDEDDKQIWHKLYL